MSGFIERVHVGKILLMQDLNVSGNYIGSKLKDVEFASIVASVDGRKSVQDQHPVQQAAGTVPAQAVDDDEDDDDEQGSRLVAFPRICPSGRDK